MNSHGHTHSWCLHHMYIVTQDPKKVSPPSLPESYCLLTGPRARAAMNVVAFTTHFLLASRIRPSNKMSERETERTGERASEVGMWGPTLQRKSLCAKESRFPLALFSHWSPPTAKQQAASPVGLDGGGSYLSRGSLLSLPHLTRHAATATCGQISLAWWK